LIPVISAGRPVSDILSEFLTRSVFMEAQGPVDIKGIIIYIN